MHFDCELDARLPVLRRLVLGLLWAAIAGSLAIVLGKVAAGVQLPPEEQIAYRQKLFFVTAAAAPRLAAGCTGRAVACSLACC
jgi:hypothetical protein